MLSIVGLYVKTLHCYHYFSSLEHMKMAAILRPSMSVVREPVIVLKVGRNRPTVRLVNNDHISEQLPDINPQLASVLNQMQDALGIVKKLEQTLRLS